ncbi:carboxylesterase/lipase family protein [Mucilaginibacter sp. UR6-11]|uniref:carboxylesterase/lipase family protein n=1 Tax=Mucilaginibacter sp. UR6-11 TaxID=1435644 RepID=UPI001E4874B6|nr:carboxylesterase/lipase family protein [Mucilaginibacter sp. UR6-11]MCC8425362.1 carboxylesterase/lipase family protein [Mucilaginibacter sp. UR6-11]
MKNNRRQFLQKVGLLTTAAGLSYVTPAVAAIRPQETPKDNKVFASAGNAVANTKHGKVRGYTRNNILTFKGIPYGAPTGGANRFMPPQKPKKWKDTRDCLVYGPICPQKPDMGWLQQEYGFLYQWIDGMQDEDCLRLNVWTPALDGKKRPVMFWIHGGGFASGSSQEHPSYDGENLTRLGDVIVVSVNHRLNIHGFLDLSDYGSQYAASGNVGMLDIVAALEWVRDNIANFGGDKNNVTIFGQSGGGSKVITLMAMPSAKGLFHRAISQSNSIVQMSTHAYATQFTAIVLADLNITKENLADLQQVKPARLQEALAVAEKKMGGTVPADVGRAGLQPVVDGKILPTHPFDPIAPAMTANVPFMVGTTRNEASYSINNAPLENLDDKGLITRLAEKYKTKADYIYQTLRKAHPDDKPIELLSYVSAQNPMAYLQASRKAAQNAAPAYLYLFAWHTPQLDGRPRSFHCSEIPFAFANTDVTENYTGASEEARKLGDKVAKAWINFARHGNPNHDGLPEWPAFTDTNGAMMVFNNTCEVQNDPDGESRKMLTRIFYNKEV